MFNLSAREFVAFCKVGPHAAHCTPHRTPLASRRVDPRTPTADPCPLRLCRRRPRLAGERAQRPAEPRTLLGHGLVVGLLTLGQPQQLAREGIAEATVEAVERARDIVSQRLPISSELRQLRLIRVRVGVSSG